MLPMRSPLGKRAFFGSSSQDVLALTHAAAGGLGATAVLGSFRFGAADGLALECEAAAEPEEPLSEEFLRSVGESV